MAPAQESYHPSTPINVKSLVFLSSVREKKRFCACFLGLLVLGTLAFGLVAFFRHKATSLRSRGSWSTFALQELSLHDTPEDCWIVINQTVYDVTKYSDHHPNPQFITLHCGRDVSSLYDSVHPISMLKIIQRRQVGVFDPAPEIEGGNQTQAGDANYDPFLTEISINELSMHSSPCDCWMAIYGTVYDVTEYAPFHPNPHFVTDFCGLEVTELFDGAHERSVVKVVQQRNMGRLSEKDTTSLMKPDNQGSAQYANWTETNTSQSLRSNTSDNDVSPPTSVPSFTPVRTPVFIAASDKIDVLFGLNSSTP